VAGLVIRGLDFTGNKAYTDEVLVTTIATTASSFFARWPGMSSRN
jgi:hypothetical protein